MLEAGLEVHLVASDRPCRGLDVARDAGIEALLIDRAAFGGFSPDFDRPAYSTHVATVLGQHDVDLIAMAGFGTVLAGSFHDVFPGRVLNTHPSLLPDFKGWHAVRDALAAGATQTGCTVHVATEALDDGPILAQRVVDVFATDDEASLHERIKLVERRLYPEVVARVMGSLGEGREPSTLARIEEF
jgi:phosphoribosylglycinamide formyltransferase-1